jgi:hypothetical protein
VLDAKLVTIRIGEAMPAPSGLVMGWSVTMTAPKLTTRPEALARRPGIPEVGRFASPSVIGPGLGRDAHPRLGFR